MSTEREPRPDSGGPPSVLVSLVLQGGLRPQPLPHHVPRSRHAMYAWLVTHICSAHPSPWKPPFWRNQKHRKLTAAIGSKRLFTAWRWDTRAVACAPGSTWRKRLPPRAPLMTLNGRKRFAAVSSPYYDFLSHQGLQGRRHSNKEIHKLEYNRLNTWHLRFEFSFLCNGTQNLTLWYQLSSLNIYSYNCKSICGHTLIRKSVILFIYFDLHQNELLWS